MNTHTLRPALSSPRSNESSHAFSLAALSAGTLAPSTTEEMTADSSGVIDISALRDGVAAQPMSGTTGSTILSAAARLVPESHAQVLPPPSAAPRWAIATVGLLAGAVAVLGTLAVATPARTTAVRDAAAPPSMAAVTAAPSVTEGDTGPESPAANLEGALAMADVDTDDAAFHGPVAMSGPEPAAEVEAPAPAPAKKAKRRTTTRKKTSTKAAAPKAPAPKADAPKAAAPKAPAAAPKSDGLSVDCILDPSSCGRGGGAKPAAPKAKSVSLPSKLSNTDLRKGLAGPKAKAKLCAASHGGSAGETVRVKLSIGGNGSVLSAKAAAPHANALGRCVANALQTAEFAPFSKPSMGVLYSVRL